MLDAVPTPYAVIDTTRLDANIATMAAHAQAQGVALRPHAKTHKMLEVAHRQQATGATGLTVATLGEALVFAEAGHDDLFVAYPLWIDAGRSTLLRRLLDLGVTLTLGCDSAAAAARIAAVSHTPRLMIEVDSGHHRSGIAPEQTTALAERLAATGLTVAGAFTFPGHSYHPDQRRTAAADEAAALGLAGVGLGGCAVADPVLSGGSTPSVGALWPGAGLTEIRPGVYVFGDAQQWELGSCTADQIAFTVHASVVSRRRTPAGWQVVLDAGSKVLGADRAGWASGYGRLLDHPNARIVQLSEHHAVVAWDPSPEQLHAPVAPAAHEAPAAQPPALGELLRVVPNHVCNAVNLVDEVWAHGGEGDVERWAVAARGRNS